MTPGTHIGSYRLLSLIGAGGMGEVWLGEHISLGRRAAIKLLRPELSSRAEVVTRFFNEARAAAAIHDPGIVQIFEIGDPDEQHAYIVMELLDGEPLDRRVARGPLAIADAARIMRQVASSLVAAHARGIVHRDLKPENIFLARDPEVASGERAKILDFGIAKLSGSVGVKTQTAAMMGTPTYMSPEQCRGAGEVDARSDIYSFGCVLFQLVTGRPPFDAEGVGEIIAMHLREPAPRATSVAPHVPAELDDLIARCLEKNPEQRMASASALAAELGALRALGAAGALTPIPRVATQLPPHSMPTTLSSVAMEVARPRGRGRWWFAGASVAVIGVFATFALMHASSNGSEDHTGSAGIVVAATPSAMAPLPAPPPAVIDNRPVEASAQVAAVVEASVTWASTHDGCPTSDDLGVLHDDAWGTPIQIRCADQQIVVVIAGPDRALGTADDISSSRARPAKPNKPPTSKKKPTVAPPPAHHVDCFEQRC